MEKAGYLAIQDRTLYVREFLPDRPEKGTVVLVPPFGEEKKCSFRLFVRLARGLCEDAFRCVLFDLSGTGESSGDHGTVTWEQWVEDVRAVALPADNGADDRPVWLLGARLGALLACEAALSCPAGLVLVEPIPSGEEVLRDLERRQKIKSMLLKGNDRDGEEAEERWQRGECVDFGGYDVGSALASSLKNRDLADMFPRLSPATTVHLVRVSGSRKWPGAWENLVAHASASPGGNAEIVRDKPFWGQLEYYESDTVIDYIRGCISGKSAGSDS